MAKGTVDVRRARREVNGPTRALRDFESALAESVAVAVQTIEKGIDGPRRDIQGLLAGSAFSDVLKHLEGLRLQEQFSGESARLKHFDLLQEDESLPFSFDQLIRSINPAQLEAACSIPEPTLLVYPKGSFYASVRAIDAHRIPDQQETHVNRGVFLPDDVTEDGVEARAWSWRIIDGREEVQIADWDWDDVSKILGERVTKARQQQRNAPLSGTDRYVYPHLQMRNLQQKGRPIDHETWTIFDADPACDSSRVPGGDFDDDRVGFDAGRPDRMFGDARFRSSVGGDVYLV